MKKFVTAFFILGVTSSLFASGADLYKGCITCHGAKGEKPAMGKSKVINAMSKADLVSSMKGYKDGSYGGPLKALMVNQVKNLSDAQIDELSAYITTLK